MEISIVTLNYHKSHLTLACIHSLWEQFSTEFLSDAIELIIVDNHSQDDSIEQIEKAIVTSKWKNITLIKNTKNDGFAKGCNIGATRAKGKYILFLNNDTLIKDRGIITMKEFMDMHDSIAILGGKLVNRDGTPQSCVGSFYSPISILLLLTGLQKYGMVDKNPEKIKKVDWVKGGLLMVREGVFNKLGGFDENIFMYTEDMEFCYRAKQQGFDVYFYPDISVYHKESGSSNRTFAVIHIYKNLLYFYKKHKSYAEYVYVKTLLRLKAMALIGIGRVQNNPYYISTYEKALEETR